MTHYRSGRASSFATPETFASTSNACRKTVTLLNFGEV